MLDEEAAAASVEPPVVEALPEAVELFGAELEVDELPELGVLVGLLGAVEVVVLGAGVLEVVVADALELSGVEDGGAA